MATTSTYGEYLQQEIDNFAAKDAENRYALVDAVKDIKIKKILDVGCGAGQEMLPFVERTDAFCVGIDVAEEFGQIGREFFQKQSYENRVSFVRSRGESLPFAEDSFDVVLCRVALPYMNNRQAISEISKVLRPGGVFLLKIHAPAFYFGMIRRGWKTFGLKQFAYPLICLTGSVWHSVTGKQLTEGFWRGKEIFQTKRFLQTECERNNLKILKNLGEANKETPSFLIVKN